MNESLPPPPEQNDVPYAFVIAWTIVGLMTYLVLGGLAQMSQLSFGLWFGEIAFFAGGAIVGWQLLRLSPGRAMGITRFEAKAFGLGVAFGLVNYFAWAIPSMALAHEIFPESITKMFDSSKIFDRQTPIELWVIVLGVTVAAPLGEEFFFRGFMQRGLEARHGAPRAIVVTAFIFSAFHLDPVGLVSRFELGVLFGLLAWKAGSIWPAIGAHAANNAISSLIFLASRGHVSDEAELPWYVPAAMFVIGNAVLYALVKAASGRLQIDTPSAIVPLASPPSPARALSPWVVGSLLAVIGIVALDWRGIALNWIDALDKIEPAVSKREDVAAMRVRARSGAIELSEYRAFVKRN